MRETYTNLLNDFYTDINMMSPSGTPNLDTNVTNFFNLHLGQRYQLILAKMNNYKTIKPYSLTTSNNAQIYPMPPGLVTIEGGYITVGSVNFPLQPINSRYNWEQLNAILIQASALPQFYFVEQDSFQIWPIPQAAYTGKIYYHFRDRNLSVADYTTGTITLTNASNSVSVSGGTFTTAITSSGFSINAAQVENTVYENANVDGSTVTSCSVSGTTIRIYIDDPTNAIAAQVIYNWYQYYLFSEAGIREQDGAYITATDDTHYIFDNTMKIINSDTANPLNITGANITPVSGAATNIFDLTNGASIALNFNRVEGFSYSSGSGLSTAEHNQVMAIPLTTPKIATDGDTNLAIINT
jgi:hypothetical protein